MQRLNFSQIWNHNFVADFFRCLSGVLLYHPVPFLWVVSLDVREDPLDLLHLGRGALGTRAPEHERGETWNKFRKILHMRLMCEAHTFGPVTNRDGD